MNETLKTLLERRSCRSYSDRQVDPAALDEILKAGTYAPTGMGRQAPKIVVVQDKETIAQLEQMNAKIMGNPDAHPFYGAPTVLIVLTDPEIFTHLEDGSLVMGNLMNAAWSVGVDSCWIHRARQEFDSPEGKALLKKWGIDERYIGVGHCILGYRTGEYRERLPRKEDFIVRV